MNRHSCVTWNAPRGVMSTLPAVLTWTPSDASVDAAADAVHTPTVPRAALVNTHGTAAAYAVSPPSDSLKNRTHPLPTADVPLSLHRIQSHTYATAAATSAVGHT